MRVRPGFKLHTDVDSLAAWAEVSSDSISVVPQEEPNTWLSLRPVLRHSREGTKEVVWMREGLVPSYALDHQDANRRAEAHAEAMTCNPRFRSAFRRRRCVVPAQVLYEVRHLSPGITQPCSFSLLTGRIFGLAAVWQTWTDSDGHCVESFAVVTVLVTPLLRGIFQRMPVVFTEPVDCERWLHIDGSRNGPVDLIRPLWPANLSDWSMTPGDVEFSSDLG